MKHAHKYRLPAPHGQFVKGRCDCGEEKVFFSATDDNISGIKRECKKCGKLRPKSGGFWRKVDGKWSDECRLCSEGASV
jgi:ribosomal protein S27E